MPRVRTPQGVVEFPDGMSEQDMAAALSQLPKPAASHSDAPKRPEEILAASDENYIQDTTGLGKRAMDRLPTIAAGAAAAASGGGVVLPAIAAGGAGFLGARLRGDARPDAAITGATEGLMTFGAGVAGKGLAKAGEFVAGRALPLVRSALKPAFADLRRRAGIEGVTPAALADRQSQFIIDHQLATPEQAAALAKSSGQQVDDAIRTAESDPNVSPVLDTANRIPRYLSAVLRKVEKQILPGKDRAAIQGVGREVVEDSPLSQQVESTTRPSPKKSGFATKWDDTAKPSRSFEAPPPAEPGARPRALRAGIRPSEGADIVRSKSFYDKDASGGTIAGGKAVERAIRDAIKESVPAAREPLMTQGRAIDAERLLDRSAWRDANRDAAPGGMGAIAGIANGRPLLGLIMQGLKEGQLAAGLAAPKVGASMQRAGGPVSHIDQLIRAMLLSQESPK